MSTHWLGVLGFPSNGVMQSGGPLWPKYVSSRFQRSFGTGTSTGTGSGTDVAGGGTLKGNVSVGCESRAQATDSADAT